MSRIVTVGYVTYPDGRIGSCYALAAADNSSAACMTIKRAADLQHEGVPYDGAVYVPESFATFFPPDFSMVGERDTTRRAEVIREETGCPWEEACRRAEHERDH